LSGGPPGGGFLVVCFSFCLDRLLGWGGVLFLLCVMGLGYLARGSFAVAFGLPAGLYLLWRLFVWVWPATGFFPGRGA
jgi:hypothetical protein